MLASSDMTESSKLLATSLISIWIDFVDLEDCMSKYNASLENQDEEPQFNNLESSVFELKNGFSCFITLLNRTFIIGVVSYHKMSDKLPHVLRFVIYFFGNE